MKQRSDYPHEMQIPIPTKSKLCPFRLAELVQLQAKNKSDESNGAGARGQYAFKLASGEYAGLFVQDDKTSSTGYTAYIVKGTDQNNVITIKNFDEAAATNTSGNGYLGIKLGAQKVALIQGDGKSLGATASNFWGDINCTATALVGKESTVAEGAGKLFTISLAVAAGPGAKIILNVAGALAGSLKAILGDTTVDANGAEITLTEGQTFVSFALTSDSAITADQLGYISAQYQTDSNDPNNPAGQSPISSNSWGLTLRDAGESDDNLRGDYKVKVDTTDTSGTGYTRIIRTHADGQVITIWREGEQRYFLDAENNLIADAAGELVTDNVISGNEGKDKIEGLTGSDLLSGGAGNDHIDGGEGADMIGGGSGSDTILGGDGDDYISSSAGIATDHQNITSTDTWNTYGLPAGKQLITAQARWGVYKDGEGDDAVTIWSGIGPTRTDTEATEGDVIDAGAGNDNVIGSWAGDRIKGGTGGDDIEGLAGSDIIEGNEGDDKLNGDGITKEGYLSSVSAANHGADFIDGGEGGNDYAEGNKGDDTIYSGATPIFVANYAENMPGNYSKRFINARTQRSSRFIAKSATNRYKNCVVCYRKRSKTNSHVVQTSTQVSAGDAA